MNCGVCNAANWMLDAGGIARAAAAIPLNRWRRNDARFTCDDIVKSMQGDALWASTGTSVAAWAADVFHHVRQVGSPAAAPTSVRSIIRATCRRRGVVFDPPPTWAPEKVLSFVEGYRGRPALAAAEAAAVESRWQFFVPNPTAGVEACTVLRNLRPSAAEFFYDDIPQSEGGDWCAHVHARPVALTSTTPA